MATWLKKLGTFVKDVAIGSVDSALSSVGAGNVIKDSAYSTQKFADASRSFQNVTNKVGTAVVSVFVPPLGAGAAVLQRFNAVPDHSNDPDTPVTDNNLTATPLPVVSDLAITPENLPEEDYTDYYIVGAIILVLLVLIISYIL